MDYEHLYDRMMNRISKGIMAFSCIVNLFICALLGVGAIFAQLKFGVIQYILKQELTIKIAMYAFIVIFALLIMEIILQCICGLMTLTSNSMNGSAKVMLLISCSVINATFIIGGLFFMGCGFYVILVSSIIGGMFSILMGALALLFGIFGMYRDVICYHEYGMETEDDPSSKRYKLKVIGEYLLPIGCGVVFCYVPLVMLSVIINSDDTVYAKIGIMGMGLVFLGVGAYVLYYAITTIKKKLKQDS